MNTLLRGNDVEALCGIIIDTLKELRWSSQPVTPSVLHRAMSTRHDYIELLTDRGLANSSFESSCQSDQEILRKQPVHEGNDSLIGSYIKTLQDFRLNLLSEFEDRLPRESLTLASEIRELISKSNKVQEILDLNDNILEILRTTIRRAKGELEQFTSLVKEIGKDLIEMETGLMSSFSCTRETFENNKAFHNTLEHNLADTTETIHISTNLIELKGFVASKLLTIKEALERKRKYDDLQLKKATGEVKKLRQSITGMKQEVVQVQKRAKVLEEETLLDPLTGVHNRRAYEKRIQEELARFERHKEIFSILMIDIDNFKSVNDFYGHWTGDRCLVELTKLIKRILRGTDFLARYGGEEFIIILPGTNEEGISIVAERMRELVEKARFIYQDEEIPLTVSIGGTTVTSSDQNAEIIFKRVDKAMYEAKGAGRNKSVILRNMIN
ncbi:MAG: diguanylate cyclase [Syntrophobacteraceae bacterium]